MHTNGVAKTFLKNSLRNVASESEMSQQTTHTQNPTKKITKHFLYLRSHQHRILSERKAMPLARWREFTISFIHLGIPVPVLQANLKIMFHWCNPLCCSEILSSPTHSKQISQVWSNCYEYQIQHLLLELLFWIAIFKDKIFSVYKFLIV